VEIRFAFAVFTPHSLSDMSDRQLILDAVQEMPETASAQEIFDELRLLTTLRERLDRRPKSKGVPAEELLRQVETWITK